MTDAGPIPFISFPWACPPELREPIPHLPLFSPKVLTDGSLLPRINERMAPPLGEWSGNGGQGL